VALVVVWVRAREEEEEEEAEEAATRRSIITLLMLICVGEGERCCVVCVFRWKGVG
jgi:hypothetical protein